MATRILRPFSTALARSNASASSKSSPSSLSSLASNFWDNISVDSDPNDSGSLLVQMAKKPLKTPLGNPLRIPATKNTFAHLIAHEWSGLSTLKLKNFHIPLTSLAARAIDVTPAERSTATAKLLPYLDTDSLLVIAPASDCDGKLRQDQLKKFHPVVEDACSVWGIDSLSWLDQEKQLFGNYQTEETKQRVTEWVANLDNWQWAAFERAVTASRSFIIGMNIATQRRSVEELAALATLDVTHQTDIWGEVEDTHDVDKVDVRRTLGAAYLCGIDESKAA